MKVPEKYYDEIFSFKGTWDMPSCCGLKILSYNGKTHIIVTELYQDNPGTSVTAAGKILFDQICSAKGFNPAEVVYLECNPDTASKLSFYDEQIFEVQFPGNREPVYRVLRNEEVKAIIRDFKP